MNWTTIQHTAATLIAFVIAGFIASGSPVLQLTIGTVLTGVYHALVA